MSTNPITKVYVTESPTDRSKLIQWKLDPSFPELTSYSFYIETARATDPSWTRLNPSAPIVDMCWYSDPTVYRYNYRHDLYYRVVLDDGGTEYISEASNVRGTLDKTERRMVRAALVNEYERFTKWHVGTIGWLLKKRIYGTACTVCADFDLPNDGGLASCSTCYGTGIVGGYYQGYPYYVDFTKLDVHDKDIVIPFGTEDNPELLGRCIAYPILSSQDLWVEKDTNKRYVIRQIQTLARIRDTVISYTAVFKELPGTRVEYDVPVYGDTALVSDVETEWRNAVDYNL